MIIHDPSELVAKAKVWPWYVETRPQQVKRLGFDNVSDWGVGQTPEGRVRWLFKSMADWQRFKADHRAFVLIAGYLGPLQTENRTWE